ncbi:hypothetical protein Dimus_036525 [Dionaea muscipula]
MHMLEADEFPFRAVNARILFIDRSTRAIGLTLNPHLLLNKEPPEILKTRDAFDQSKIIRIDKGLGLLLQISDVADEEILKLERKFKEGSQVRARILGYRHLEGLAMGFLKVWSSYHDNRIWNADLHCLRPGDHDMERWRFKKYDFDY